MAGTRIARFGIWGYPSHEVLAAWIDELAPGERRIRVNEIPEEQRGQAVPAMVSGGLKSRRVAAGLGVNDATVVKPAGC
jgi:hypothetical protein